MLCDQFGTALWNVHLRMFICMLMYLALECIQVLVNCSVSGALHWYLPPQLLLYSVDFHVMCFWHCTWSEYLRNCGLVPSMGRFFSSPKRWLWFWDPTQPDIQWVPWSVGWGMMVTSGLHLVFRLRINGVLLPLLHLLSWHLQRWLYLLSLWRQNMVNGLY